MNAVSLIQVTVGNILPIDEMGDRIRIVDDSHNSKPGGHALVVGTQTVSDCIALEISVTLCKQGARPDCADRARRP